MNRRLIPSRLLRSVSDRKAEGTSVFIDNSNHSNSLLEGQSPLSTSHAVFTFSAVAPIEVKEEGEEITDEEEEEDSENINPTRRKDPFGPSDLIVPKDSMVYSSSQQNLIAPLTENHSSNSDDKIIANRSDEEPRMLSLSKSELEFFERPSNSPGSSIPAHLETGVSFQNLSPTTQSILALYGDHNSQKMSSADNTKRDQIENEDEQSQRVEQKREDRIVTESSSTEIEVKSFTDVWLELQPKPILVKSILREESSYIQDNDDLYQSGVKRSSSSSSSSSLSSSLRKTIRWPEHKEDLVSIQYIPRVGKARSLRLALMQIKKMR